MKQKIPIGLLGLVIWLLPLALAAGLVSVLFLLSGESSGTLAIVMRVFAIVLGFVVATVAFFRISLMILLRYTGGSDTKSAAYSYFVDNGFFPKNDRLLRHLATASECRQLDELKNAKDLHPERILGDLPIRYRSSWLFKVWFPLIWFGILLFLCALFASKAENTIAALLALPLVFCAWLIAKSARTPSLTLGLDEKGLHYAQKFYSWDVVHDIQARAQPYTNQYVVAVQMTDDTLDIDTFGLGADSFFVAWQMKVLRDAFTQHH